MASRKIKQKWTKRKYKYYDATKKSSSPQYQSTSDFTTGQMVSSHEEIGEKNENTIQPTDEQIDQFYKFAAEAIKTIMPVQNTEQPLKLRIQNRFLELWEAVGRPFIIKPIVQQIMVELNVQDWMVYAVTSDLRPHSTRRYRTRQRNNRLNLYSNLGTTKMLEENSQLTKPSGRPNTGQFDGKHEIVGDVFEYRVTVVIESHHKIFAKSISEAISSFDVRDGRIIRVEEVQ